MKVKELIKELKEADPELDIILAKDSEGNDFSPLADVRLGSYTALNSYSGEFSDDQIEESNKAVCLWPTN